jgi:hypothetical protein
MVSDFRTQSKGTIMEPKHVRDSDAAVNRDTARSSHGYVSTLQDVPSCGVAATDRNVSTSTDECTHLSYALSNAIPG